jgi:hypothetical protein
MHRTHAGSGYAGSIKPAQWKSVTESTRWTTAWWVVDSNAVRVAVACLCVHEEGTAAVPQILIVNEKLR